MNRVVNVLEQFEALTSFKRQSRLRIVNAELALEEVWNTAIFLTTLQISFTLSLYCLIDITPDFCSKDLIYEV